jgi:hypothetical protein
MKTRKSESWWRPLLNKKSSAAFAELDEIPAFRYELARRLFPPEEYPPYVQLNRWELDIARRLLGHGNVPAMVIHRSPELGEMPGYWMPAMISWNLQASDRALITSFLDAIQSERKKRGIKPPPRNAGNLNRGVSWDWLDILDNPTGADRSKKAQATKAAKNGKAQFLEVWKRIADMRLTHARLAAEDPSLRKMLKERVSWSSIVR